MNGTIDAIGLVAGVLTTVAFVPRVMVRYRRR